MGRQPAAHGLDHLGMGGPDLGPDQAGKPLGITFAGCERLKQDPSALAHDVREHRAELDVGGLKGLVGWTWLAFSRVSCLRARVRSRSACSGIVGTKLGRMRPWASRSASHVASFTSVLRPGTALTGWALASTSSKSPAKTAQTGFQYTPVASIATAVTPWPVSHSESRSSSVVVVAKVSTNRTTPPASAKRTQATMVSRWMSSPAQRA